jgi:hypothetical protein
VLSQVDEVLLTIPTDRFEQARHTVLSSLRVYHRLPDFLLVGSAREVATQLNKKGLGIAILDDNPWSEAYAVVGNHPGNRRSRSYDRINCRILYTSSEYDIIKAPARVFQRLREQGFTCVEIERIEVPLEVGLTRVPDLLLDRPNDLIADIIVNVSDTIIRATIQGFSDLGTRYWNNVNHDSVSRWVRAKYLTTGITDVALDSFQYNSTWQANVLATIPGTVSPTAELIVGGHHDDMPSTGLAPGADDNASGTAAAIEMARVLKLVNYQPRMTMRFMGFAAEEAGLRGSASYAQRARTADRDIRVMQNYDMIANRYQAPTDNSVYVVWYTTSEAYRDLHSRMMQMYTPLIPVATTSYRSGSDSYSFWQQNYRTVFCIEKNFSPYYHTSNDLLQYLDMTYCANIVKSGLAMLLTLDMMPASVSGLQVLDCGNGTSLYARWDSVQVPDWYRYKVNVGTAPGVYTSNTLVTNRWARLDGLTTGTRYYVGVSIVDLAGQEGMITEISEVPLVIPRRPDGLWAWHGSGGPCIAWRGNPEMDLQGYDIYRGFDSVNFTKLNVLPHADTLWVDTLGTAWPRYYFVRAVDSTGNASAPSDTVGLGPTGVGDPRDFAPAVFALEQNYPNPFNPMTNVEFRIAKSEFVSLRMYDALGREVSTLVNEHKAPGIYRVVWNAADLASGVYLCRMTAGTFAQTRKFVLMR